MKLSQAIDLIQHPDLLDPGIKVWADLGAGEDYLQRLSHPYYSQVANNTVTTTRGPE
jgi:hypothetical protein